MIYVDNKSLTYNNDVENVKLKKIILDSIFESTNMCSGIKD